jgi:putative membrane protein
MLENLLVAVAIAVLVWIYRRVAFSRSSWVLVSLFLCVHEIGAHWTYSLVPYREFLGMTVGENSRNHFDRLVHFLYGLLLVWPMRDLLLSLRLVPVRSASLIAINLIISTSTIYELAEWLVGEYIAGELAGAYLGMQGDVWDAQKDIALAALGSLITVAAAFLLHFRQPAAPPPSGQSRA